MLPDFGGDVDVAAARRLEQPLDRELRQDDIVVLFVRQRVARAPFGYFLPPAADVRLFGFGLLHLQQILEHVSGIADDRHVDADVLVDR
jgi:hypothetical protein